MPLDTSEIELFVLHSDLTGATPGQRAGSVTPIQGICWATLAGELFILMSTAVGVHPRDNKLDLQPVFVFPPSNILASECADHCQSTAVCSFLHTRIESTNQIL